MKRLVTVSIFTLLLVLMGQFSFAAEQQEKPPENASNPLATVNNTDVRVQYFDLRDGFERYDFYLVDGSYMVTPS